LDIIIDGDFTKDNNKIARGHLAAKSDFVFAPLKDATYYYYNAAPQWQGFNGLNWQAVENSVEIKVNELQSDARIYTGVYVSIICELT
jgi:DNA/RNA endonuclease G (NUC1)